MRMIVLLLTAFALLSSSPSYSATTLPPTAYEQSLADLAGDHSLAEKTKLWKLFDAYWDHQMTEFPDWATQVGYPGQNARWTDLSFEAVARRKREVAAPMTPLLSIDRSKLDPADRVNYDLLKYQTELDVEGSRFKDELMPINQMGGINTSAPDLFHAMPAATARDYEDMIARLKALPKAIDQTIALMREGLKEGITVPKIILRDVPDQIKAQVVDDPEKSAFYEPFKKLPSGLPAADRDRLTAEARKAVADAVVPAYRKLAEFFVTEYLPHCRETIALTSLPDGEAWYAHNVRAQTTTDFSPQKIHEIGVAEVARIHKEMEAVIQETGFKGNFSEFSKFMRTDPQFFYKDPKDLLIGYRDIAKRIDPELITVIGKLPRLPYGVLPVPAYMEKSQTTAYYWPGSVIAGRAGTFYANTYDIGSRPKWEMETLTLHEAVPGHHLQIALALEMSDLPAFRKNGEFTAYTEGWGLYSESLGSRLGLYETPYYRYGQLTYEMWRAVRLVVDTGMHSLGWSRRQAIDYFKENTSKTDHDITVEVDRYIAWPGQALAYKIGQMKMLELRERAKKELGDRFDIRAFHDAVLETGSVPLDVLDRHIADWTAAQEASPAPAAR
ncbi:MAG: DUF885 domain-containing protein [Elusimicrobiota bacterium]